MFIFQSISAVVRDESGQDQIEYALAAGLVSLAAIASMRSLATVILNTFNGMGTSFTAAV